MLVAQQLTSGASLYLLVNEAELWGKQAEVWSNDLNSNYS